MKLLHVVGLITVVMLTALFFYVLEDVPSFGDPHSPANGGVFLFNASPTAQVIDSLNKGELPDSLREEFERIGMPVGECTVKRVEGRHGEEGYEIWVHVNESEYNTREHEIPLYFISKDFEVYRYPPSKRYIERVEEEGGVPNMVTAILADYRGYDTLGETTVIFTAGVAVILLLRRYGRL